MRTVESSLDVIVIGGGPAAVAYAKAVQPKPNAGLAAALAVAGDTPVKAAVIPSQAMRDEIAKNAPPQIAGKPTTYDWPELDERSAQYEWLQNDLQTELARTKLDMAAGPSGVIASAVQQASQAAPTGRLIDRLFPDRQEAARRGGEVGRSFASNTLASLKLVGERIKEAVFPGSFFEKSFAGVQRRAKALRERMAQPSLSAISPELTTRELTLERIRSRAQERARERAAAREDANRSVAAAVQTGNRIGQALGGGIEAGQRSVAPTLGQLKSTQVRSGIVHPHWMRRTLAAIGLKGHQQSVIHADTPSLRGQIKQVRHLVEVTPVEGSTNG
jgi:large subunit ribosomal protein L30